MNLNTLSHIVKATVFVSGLLVIGCTETDRINSGASPSITSDTVNNTINDMEATRPASEGGGDWTDTPANQPEPNLSGEETQEVAHCPQDAQHIYAIHEGCLFSVEGYRQGQLNILVCIDDEIYLNDSIVGNMQIGNLTLSCQGS